MQTNTQRLNELTAIIFSELAAKSGKTISVQAEGQILVVRVGSADTRIMNWENMDNTEIVGRVRSFVYNENASHGMILHG